MTIDEKKPIAVVQAAIERTFAMSIARAVKVEDHDGLTQGLAADGSVVWTMGSDAYKRLVERVEETK